MLAPLHPVRDLRLNGQVIYVGKSSMEIAVQMEALNIDGTEDTVMLGEWYPAVQRTLLISTKVDFAWCVGIVKHSKQSLFTLLFVWLLRMRDFFRLEKVLCLFLRLYNS